MTESTDPPAEDRSPLAQAGEDLFAYAIDREDIKWSLAHLPAVSPVDRTAVEYELQILKIVSVGWSVNYCLAHSPYKEPLQQRYWSAVQTFAHGLSQTTGLLIGQEIDYFQALKDRLDAYIDALGRRPQASEPAVAIGPAFAQRCNLPGDLFTASAGARMFNSAIARVRAYLEATGLTACG